eukprot:g7962.t1
MKVSAIPSTSKSSVLRTRCPVRCVAGEPTLIVPKYAESTHQTIRRKTRTCQIGKVPVGSDHPIALQTMTTTDTRDVEATVLQVKKCVDAGADLVRLTVQGLKEAESCFKIREQLFKDRYDVPLVADIHFSPKVAMKVAEAFEKIRVNPGNFVDGRKKFDVINYDDPKQFEAERDLIEEIFTPLVLKCKELNRAIRIGTNHGSLSARILSYFGDTPRGMVESAFEFADICRKHDFHNFLFSMKASNPLVMVQAYRLLSEEMYNRGWDYPLHLGVTEAGEGEDGRMKSAVGIGTLLMDGLGDTIRVSLTEDPEFEIQPCSELAQIGTRAAVESWGIDKFPDRRDTRDFAKRHGTLPVQKEGESVDYRPLLHRDGSVLSAISLDELKDAGSLYKGLGAKIALGLPFKDIATSDTLLMHEVPETEDSASRKTLKRLQEVGVHLIAPAEALHKSPVPHAVALYELQTAVKEMKEGLIKLPPGVDRVAISVHGMESEEEIEGLKSLDPVMILLKPEPGVSRVHASRRFFSILKDKEISTAVIHHYLFDEGTDEQLIIHSGSQVGAMLIDGLGDGVLLESPDRDLSFLRTTSFGMLQASRMRNTKTEFVSCPSCGRTLFDLQEVTDQIRQRTGHLPGVAIAVMGCIVNGPGEMADADFGYVGGAPGLIDLYVGKELVQRGIPMDEATEALVDLIKEHDRWVDPPAEEEGASEEVAVAA